MKTAYLVAGLAFGDEGKGSIVDYLTRKCQSSLIVRYNGGPQAAHNVITPDKRHHTFSQFGSGMFVDGVRTHLSRFMLVNPLNMMNEEEHLRELGMRGAWDRITVDGDCLIVTPFHKAINRTRELSLGDNRHGSCGQGIGVAREWHLKFGNAVLFAKDLRDFDLTRKKLYFLREQALKELPALGNWGEAEVIINATYVEWAAEQYMRWPAHIVRPSFLGEVINEGESIIFEGAQGMMIDEKYGTAPHNTWTDCTFNNAEALLNDVDYDGKVVKVGVLRSYYTRHGAGPFPTEDENLHYPELHNGRNEYQGAFRLGHFDFDLAKYALDAIGGVDFIALNHLDHANISQVSDIKEKLSTPVGIVGWGPTADEKESIL